MSKSPHNHHVGRHRRPEEVPMHEQLTHAGILLAVMFVVSLVLVIVLGVLLSWL